MYTIQAMFIVAAGIAVWIFTPILVALGVTVALIFIVRALLKEYANEQKRMEEQQNER